MNYSVIEGLEEQLADTKAKIERGQLARKLESNREFRKLILEGFCLRDAAANVALSADPASNDRVRADALAAAQAGGHLKRYLHYVQLEAMAAQNDLGRIEEELDEVRAAEAAD